VLLGVTILLTIATLLRLEGEGWSAILSLALAMGVANAAIAGRDGSVIGVTHMTGTLVQMGQKIANAVRGEGDRRWLDHLGLWAALVGGALLGARAVIWSPPLAYALAVALAAVLALRAGWIVRNVGLWLAKRPSWNRPLHTPKLSYHAIFTARLALMSHRPKRQENFFPLGEGSQCLTACCAVNRSFRNHRTGMGSPVRSAGRI